MITNAVMHEDGPGDRDAFQHNQRDLTPLAEMLQHRQKKLTRVDRRAKVAHVGRENAVKTGHQFRATISDFQSALLTFADLIADLRFK